MATATLKVRDIGDPFPAIKLPSVYGDGDIEVASFQGKRLLMFMWSSW